MKKGSLIIAASAIAVLVVLAVLSRFLVDLLWFDSLGFRAVFMTVWLTEIGVFLIVASVSSVLLLLNGLIAVRASASLRPRGFRVVGRNQQGLPEAIEISLSHLPWRALVLALSVIIGVFIGFAQTGNWDTILKWLYAVPFNR